MRKKHYNFVPVPAITAVIVDTCVLILMQLEQLASKANKKIPDDIDYKAISTLSLEAREKLSKVRPRDIGQASRIGGVNPADVSALLVHLEIQKRRAAAAASQSSQDGEQHKAEQKEPALAA